VFSAGGAAIWRLKEEACLASSVRWSHARARDVSGAISREPNWLSCMLWERASGGRVVDRVPDCEKKKTKKTKKTKETVSASLCVSGGRAGARARGVAGGAAIWRMKEF
jgi:hypothetical protein